MLGLMCVALACAGCTRQTPDGQEEICPGCGKRWDEHDHTVSALMTAVENGRVKEVERLIAAGANITNTVIGYPLLITALTRDDRYGDPVEMVKVLLSAGASPNTIQPWTSYPALLVAIQNGQTNCIRELLLAGADVNGTPSYGKTGLMVAIHRDTRKDTSKYFQIVNDLIAAGVDVNAQDKNGSSALSYAVMQSERVKVQLVEALLAAGADIDARGSHDRTELMYASWRGYTDNVKMLLAFKADVNIQNKDGYTALMFAAQNYSAHPAFFKSDARRRTARSIEVMKELLAAGADVNAKTEKGETALSLAKDPEIIKLLRDAGAKE